MDEKNKKILKLLDRDGRISLTDIGKKLDMSPAAVKKRLDNMLNEKLRIKPVLNSEILNLKTAILLLEVTDDEAEEEIIDRYGKCPRILYLSRVMGEYTLMTLILVEDAAVLESCARKCLPRTGSEIRKSNIIVGEPPLKPSFIQYIPPAEEDETTAPCGETCGQCDKYQKGECIGCPATGFYKK